MSPWRRLVRWLARKEIAQAFEGVSQAAMVVAGAMTSLREQIAYGRGERAGMENAFEAMRQSVSERSGREITAEDVERAKNRLVH